MIESPLLEVRSLVKRYDGRAVVNRLGFHVNHGEIVGLLGRNGAGKTTTFRITVGMIDAEEGTVAFDGRDVTSPGDVQACPTGNGVPVAGTKRVSKADPSRRTSWPSSRPCGISPGGRGSNGRGSLSSSSGWRSSANSWPGRCRVVSVANSRSARALVTDPKLIMLDEPFSGVDPKAVEDLQQEILHLRRDPRNRCASYGP